MKILRVLRLVKSLKGLEKLIQTLRWSLQALGNVLILLTLVIVIFSVLGSYIFDFKYADYSYRFQFYDENFNFNNFYHSFLLIFRITTGEDWPAMMNELAKCMIFSFFFLIMFFLLYIHYKIQLTPQSFLQV